MDMPITLERILNCVKRASSWWIAWDYARWTLVLSTITWFKRPPRGCRFCLYCRYNWYCSDVVLSGVLDDAVRGISSMYNGRVSVCRTLRIGTRISWHWLFYGHFPTKSFSTPTTVQLHSDRCISESYAVVWRLQARKKKPLRPELTNIWGKKLSNVGSTFHGLLRSYWTDVKALRLIDWSG